MPKIINRDFNPESYHFDQVFSTHKSIVCPLLDQGSSYEDLLWLFECGAKLHEKSRLGQDDDNNDDGELVRGYFQL